MKLLKIIPKYELFNLLWDIRHRERGMPARWANGCTHNPLKNQDEPPELIFGPGTLKTYAVPMSCNRTGIRNRVRVRITQPVLLSRPW